MNGRKVIFDVDTGSDDAVALIAAVRSTKLQILGISTVFGSAPLDETTRHTLQILDLLKVEIPVYSGCHEALARRFYDDGRPVGVGENKRIGAGGNVVGFHEVFDLPEPQRIPEAKNGVTFLRETLRDAQEGITVIATGALTNLACAWLLDPDAFRNVEELVVMGGGINLTNKTAAAEGNFLRDPEAARILLESGVKITLITLDATHSAALGAEDLERLETLENPLARFTSGVVKTRMRAYRELQCLGEEDQAVLHDLACVLYLLDSDLILESRNCQATVSLDYGESAGALVVDRRAAAYGKGTLYVVTRLDRKRFMDDLMKLLCY